MVDSVKREVRVVKYKTGEYDLTGDLSFKDYRRNGLWISSQTWTIDWNKNYKKIIY